MTNKQKYKQAFSVLHTSGELKLEVSKMKDLKRKRIFKTAAAILAVCVCISGGTGAVYAADVGGIQRAVQVWIHGEQTDVTVKLEPAGTYEMQYQDSEGRLHQQNGGGVALEADGTQRPATEEELLERLSDPEVEYLDDGSVWLYCYDQQVDITDKFEDDVCYVTLKGPDRDLYLTVKYRNGYAISEKKYVSPDEFN